MKRLSWFGAGEGRRFPIWLVTLIVMASALVACGGPPAEELAAVDYTPLPGEDWPVSTPEEQGLDPMLIAELYHNASELETIHSVLVIKNGKLIAEDYFNGGSINKKGRVQSVTKSITSALVGIALEQGCLKSLDQKMMAFFPELAGEIQDPRKNEITIRQLLQMRAGYAWEESTPELLEILYSGLSPSSLVDVPLTGDPGTKHDYSNLSSHLLGIIIARACDTDLKSFAEEHLFSPLDVEIGSWQRLWEGYYSGHADLNLRARDMAKFGLMYLDDGRFEGEQIVPAEWVDESLQTYSEDAWYYRVGSNWDDPGYGYQWWAVTAGDHRYYLAWGHGGQQIAVLDDLDMVIVATANPLVGQHGDEPWKLEKANLNLVADLIASLPAE